MIEKLNGTTETVDFMVSTTVRMYHNNTPENFPTHWHLPGRSSARLKTVTRQTLPART